MYDKNPAGPATDGQLRRKTIPLLANQQRPLMPAFDQAEADEEPPTEADSEDAPGPQEGGDDPYDWRAEPLTELALPGALHAILIHEGIETMGQLEGLRGEIIAGRRKWPKGVGPAKVTLIEDRGTRGHGRKKPRRSGNRRGMILRVVHTERGQIIP